MIGLTECRDFQQRFSEFHHQISPVVKGLGGRFVLLVTEGGSSEAGLSYFTAYALKVRGAKREEMPKGTGFMFAISLCDRFFVGSWRRGVSLPVHRGKPLVEIPQRVGRLQVGQFGSSQHHLLLS